VLVVRNDVQMLNEMEKTKILAFRDAMYSQASSGRSGAQGVLVRNDRMGEQFKNLVDYLTIDRHGCASSGAARALWEGMTNDVFFTMLLSHVDVDTSGASHLSKSKQLVGLCTAFHPDAWRGPVSCDTLTTEIHLALETSPASYTVEVERLTVKEVLRVWKFSKQPVLIIMARELDLALNSGRNPVGQESGTHARPFPAFLRQVRTLLNGFHKSFVHLQSLGFLAPASDGFSRSAEDWAKLTKPRAIAAVAVEGEQTLAAVSTQIVRPLAKGKKPYPTDPALLCNMCGRKRHGPDGCFLKLTRTQTKTLLRVLQCLQRERRIKISFLSPIEYQIEW
jgi:hypothetical protein